MKKEQKERLHEDDRFVKLVSGAWDGVLARRRRFLLLTLLVTGALLAFAVFSGVREVVTKRALNAVDTAETIEQMAAAAKQHPGRADLLLELGRRYHQRGDEGDLARAEEALAKAADAADDKLLEGMIELARGKVEMDRAAYEAALAHFDAAANNTRARPLVGNEATFLAARCLEHLGENEQAAERYASLEEETNSLWQQMAQFRLTKLRQNPLK
ncbi:MAG: hypothetical protein R6V58_07565 [Planctomycetota bacterium]